MTTIVVFDTVCLVQAAGTPEGPAGKCLELLWDGKLTVVMGSKGLAEITDVLNRPKLRKRYPHLTDDDVAGFLSKLANGTNHLLTVPDAFQYNRDPKDEHVLNLALAANAAFIVTRDNDLLDLMRNDDADGVRLRQAAPDLRIVNPVEFLNLMQPNP